MVVRNLSLLLAFVASATACDFGASSFEILDPLDPEDLAGSGGQGGSSGATGGVDGSGGTLGSGGVGTTPVYSCAPLGAPLDVFTPDELMGLALDDPPFLVEVDNDTAIAVARYRDTMSNQRVVLARVIQDRNSEPLGAELFQYGPTPFVRLGGGTVQQGNLVLPVENAGQFGELRIPFDGDNFGATGFAAITVPDECEDQILLGVEGSVREIAPSFRNVAPNKYVLTCEDSDGNVAPYIGDEVSGFEALGSFDMNSSSLVRRVFELEGMTFLLTGGDFGDSSFRFGSTNAELMTSHTLSFDDDRITSFGVSATSDLSGLFFFGGAITGPVESPMLTPAEIFTGTVPVDELGTFNETVPPAHLVPRQTLENQADLYKFDRLYARDRNVYQIGTTVSPPNKVSVSVLNENGEFLAANFIVEEDPDNLATFDNASVTRLGIGMVTLYANTTNHSVRMRRIRCGE